MQTSAVFEAKTSDILKFMMYPYRQGREGVKPMQTFCAQKRDVNFLRFSADVFYDRLLLYKVS